MKFFGATKQTQLVMVGLNPTEPTQKNPMNARSVPILIALFTASFLSLMFFLRESKGFAESVNSLYVMWSMFTCGVNFLIMIWKRDSFYEFIANFQVAIAHRMYK